MRSSMRRQRHPARRQRVRFAEKDFEAGFMQLGGYISRRLPARNTSEELRLLYRC